MSETFARGVVDALLPQGFIWKPSPGGALDHLLDGVSDNFQEVIDDLANLATIRNPITCPAELLPDLEREFGISPSDSLTEIQRRANLSVFKYHRLKGESLARLQDALDCAGFGTGGYGLMVTQNASPAIPPEALVENCYQMTAQAYPSTACAGNKGAYAAKRGGYYLVNGDKYQGRPVYPQAGNICARWYGGANPGVFTGIGEISRIWTGICSDPTGNLWVSVDGGDIYKCPAGSTTFTAIGGTSRAWIGICSDPTGNLWAAVYGGDIYKCPAGSTTFTAIGGTSRNWMSIGSDPTGNLWAVVNGGDIYKCPAGSTTFTAIGGTSRNWRGICSDPTGNLWAVVNGGDIYKCPAGSTTFTAIGGTSRAWRDIGSDPTGNLWAVVYGGDIYKCPAGSMTFTAIGGTSRNWRGIGSDPTGNLWAVVYASDIYVLSYQDTQSLLECAGYYDSYEEFISEYESPAEPIWPMVFFLGGEGARNIDGSLAAITTVWIPGIRRQELHRLVIRLKPLGIWAAMIVQYN